MPFASRFLRNSICSLDKVATKIKEKQFAFIQQKLGIIWFGKAPQYIFEQFVKKMLNLHT